MLKLILNNLWTRRCKNGWLLAELILVSILSWVILDPVIVVTHDRQLPLGYDAHRLCLVSLSALQPQAMGYNSLAQDSAQVIDHYLNLVRRTKDFPGVEQASPILGFCYINSRGNGSIGYRVEGDTLDHHFMWMQFLPHTQFFETYGLRSGIGKTTQQLSDYNYTQNDLVFSENAVEKLFRTKNPLNKHCLGVFHSDTTYYNIIGAVGKFKCYSEWRPMLVAFIPTLSINPQDIPENAQILIRIKEDVSMDRFMHDFRPWMVKEMKRGNLFARDLRSYSEVIVEREEFGSASIYRRNLAMAIFFFTNLCLGVIGTFWLQTRIRRAEVGIMLSFGATRGYIVKLLMGEGVVLTSVASLTGFLIYLQYALKEGLHPGQNTWMQSTEQYWVSDFAQHYLIVSAIIYVILLIVVLVGIYLPANSISRITAYRGFARWIEPKFAPRATMGAKVVDTSCYPHLMNA